jgi:hypothetical protein
MQIHKIFSDLTKINNYYDFFETIHDDVVYNKAKEETSSILLL